MDSIELKKANTALWNAAWGARMIHVPNSVPARVLSFVRQNKRNKVFAVLNFSGESQDVAFKEDLYPGRYTEYFSQERVELTASTHIPLKPWGYQIFIQ